MALKDKDKRNEYLRNWRRSVGQDVVKSKHRNWRLQKIYGIDLQQYTDLLEGQDFRCALCKRHVDELRGGYALAVDHSHATGEIRGLLCSPCNRTMASQRDLDYFERAVEYLTSMPTGKSGKTIRRQKLQKEVY